MVMGARENEPVDEWVRASGPKRPVEEPGAASAESSRKQGRRE